MFLDARFIRRAFGRIAADYDNNAVLQTEVGNRLLERVEGLNIEPQVILDLGAGTARQSVELKRGFPDARVLALDLSGPMLKQARQRQGWFRKRFFPLIADAGALPLATSSVDLVYCNLVVQWCEDLPGILNNLRRIVRPDGLVLLSTLGPDTLGELRQAWAEVDECPHVGRFGDVQEMGQALTGAGFAEPVLDTDWITTTHATPRALLEELRASAATNADSSRRKSLTAPGRLKALEKAYEQFRTKDGRYPATWEVVYASAWGPPEGQPIRTGAGEEASFSIDRLRRRN